MSFFKDVLFPPIIGAIIGFSMILGLSEIGFFDGLSNWESGFTGMGCGCFGVIVGYWLQIRLWNT
jgi:hypothetical protein